MKGHIILQTEKKVNESRCANWQVDGKILQTPSAIPYCWREYDVNPIINADVDLTLVQGFVLPLFRVDGALGRRITLSKQLNLKGEPADSRFLGFKENKHLLFGFC